MGGEVSDEELTEAIVMASRAMVAVAVRSLAGAEQEVTLPQYRTLVVLAYGEARRLADLASNLGVSPSTATRMCDRLVRKGLVNRSRDEIDRREVNLTVTDAGRQLVESVMERRRQDVREVLSTIPSGARGPLMESLQLLSTAVGESSDMTFSSAWSADRQLSAAELGVTPSNGS